jgi:hypothetical protein
LLRPAGESQTGISPRTPSIVSRTCKPKPAGHAHGDFLWRPCTRALFHPLSIRATRQALLRTSSRLAPSRHQQALRPPGGEDAQCVQPTSATQTNYVHPHLVCSRLALATFAARTPHGVLGSARHDRGTGRFTASEDRFSGLSSSTNLTVLCGERGRFLPTVLMQSSLWHSCRDLWIRSPPHEPSLVLQRRRAPRFWSGVWVGECRDRQDRHYRRLVKADAS